MNQDQASNFLYSIKEGQRALEKAANYLLELERSAENESLRQKLTEILALTITELELPIAAQFPHLNTYK